LPVALTSGHSHVLANDRSREFELLYKPYPALELQASFDRALKTTGRCEQVERASVQPS